MPKEGDSLECITYGHKKLEEILAALDHHGFNNLRVEKLEKTDSTAIYTVID